MTKPALLRPRAFELIAGLALVVLAAGFVVVRNGPRQSWADETLERPRMEDNVAVPAAQVRPHEDEAIAEAVRDESAIAAVPPGR